MFQQVKTWLIHNKSFPLLTFTSFGNRRHATIQNKMVMTVAYYLSLPLQQLLED